MVAPETLKNIAVRTLLLGVSLLMALGIAEITLKAFRPVPIILPYEYLPEKNLFIPKPGLNTKLSYYAIESSHVKTIKDINALHYKWTPKNSFHAQTNAFGGRGLLPQSKSNKLDILSLGDSINFGFTVDENQYYSSLLNQWRPTANLSLPGANTDYLAKLYDQFGKDLGASTVLVQVTNGILSMDKLGPHFFEHGVLLIKKKVDLLKNHLQDGRLNIPSGPAGDALRATIKSEYHKHTYWEKKLGHFHVYRIFKVIALRYDPLKIFIYQRIQLKNVIENSVGKLQSLQHSIESNGSKMIVVITPNRIECQVSEIVDMSFKFEQALSDQGIATISLTKDFCINQGRPTDDDIFTKNEVHPSPKGHQMIYQKIKSHIGAFQTGL